VVVVANVAPSPILSVLVGRLKGPTNYYPELRYNRDPELPYIERRSG
jgi:hypothetical protein